MSVPVVAIFDIGKTNKKLFLFDEHYHVVLEKNAQFEETRDEDGDACENVAQLTAWVKEQLDEVVSQFDVKAVNFTTYGASFVHIDDKGRVVTPLYNYLKPYPQPVSDAFFSRYGGEVAVSRATASPVLGSLNSGLQLYRIKQLKSLIYSRIKWSLHLPQYISFLITNKTISDITSIGCHTQLWDFDKNTYHQWVIAEGIDKKLAPIAPSDSVVPVTVHGKELQVGGGLHDSSSALIPYLACFSEPFVLLSTGTWCISLNPFNANPLTPEELAQDCLCYMEYHGKPVKASRLFAGNEHEIQTKKLSAKFNKPLDHFKEVEFNPDMIASIQPAPKPRPGEEVEGLAKSAFYLRDLDDFTSYEEAYHCLISDIMELQKTSAQLVIQDTGVKRIFVDGGFSKNPVYMHLLAQAFPKMEVFAASVAQATAVGAALAVHKHWNHKPLPGDLIEMKYYRVAQNMEI
ncbi:Sugar (pentulose or hexulose) kinase [Filimonas lacunae]|uniref:Sugar (Pentulose or hexulose) kinase n=1 Tax=Filimonas lacunae TaxID=477680 RepID=A0A173MN98_9BACT|nr:FGGY family carbohydrate kinase [Filimonas lacunae]BAV08871.1 rhamnulokinase rhaK in alpha-proteobacteria [Filimonas lacunae]SIS63130.1 Sugar (pentulose or hexulose) kinase [Filimonas lacunae]